MKVSEGAVQGGGWGIYLGEGFEAQGCGHGPSGGTHVSCSQLPVGGRVRTQAGEVTSPACGSLFQGHAKFLKHEA